MCHIARGITGKMNPERRAVTGAAVGRDRAAVLFENPAADGESKSGAAGSGAESGVEDVRQIVRHNARPGIAYRDFDTPDFDTSDFDTPDFDSFARDGAAVARGAVDAAQAEPSAARHKAKRVEREVEQHLLQPVPVSLNDDAMEAIDD